MRDLSCYLSSFSVHAFAVALITAAGVLETPDFAVTSGGVSITGSTAEVAVDTRSDFRETLPPKTEASADPFRVPVTDAASSAANRQPPESAAVSAPRKPRRPTAGSPQALIETIVIPHEGLLERIGEESAEESQQVAENQPTVRKDEDSDQEGSRRGAETAEEVDFENEAVPVDVEKTAPRKDSASSAPLHENPQSSKSDSREVAKPAKEKQEADREAESSPKESSKADSSTESQKKTSSKNSQAAPSANESSGAKVDQLPQKLPSNPSPDYPLEAWQKRQEGLVYLLVRVTAGGRAERVRVYRSSGFALLDSAAKKAVGSWKFRPASRAGEAVASPVVVPVRFQIQRQ